MCRHLHPQDLKHFNLKSTKYFLKKYDYSSALKAGGFLAAMKQGAIAIFHANPGSIIVFNYFQKIEFLIII